MRVLSARAKGKVISAEPVSRLHMLFGSHYEPNRCLFAHSLRSQPLWHQPRLDLATTEWPHFTWQGERLATLVRACKLQCKGDCWYVAGVVMRIPRRAAVLGCAALQNILASSAIRVKTLMSGRWRSTLAAAPGVDALMASNPRSEGYGGALLLDATGILPVRR